MIKSYFHNFLAGIGFLLCFIQSVDAQNTELHFTTLTSKDGLPSNTINAILKDRYGLLWFATQDGLAKFNGLSFEIYRHDINKNGSIASNEIYSLHEDKAGRLWIGTNKGLQQFNRRLNSFIRYPEQLLGTGSSAGNVKNICSDNQGNLWVATLGGLSILNPKTGQATKFNDEKSIPAEICRGEVISVYADSRGKIWIGTKNGLFNYDIALKRFTTFKHRENEPASICGDLIKTITEDPSGGLWFGTSSGLSRYDRTSGKFESITSEDSPERISNNTVYSLSFAGPYSLWVGTENGLDILNINTRKITHYYPVGRDMSSISGRSVRSILNDRDGITWVGTYDAGISKYDRNLTFFNLHKNNPYDTFGLSAPFVTALAPGFNKSLFIGTDGGGLNIYHPDTKLFSKVPLDVSGREAANLKILALEKSRSGALWIGTYQTGLYKLDPVTGRVDHFAKGWTDKMLNNNEVFCLQEDKEGQLWIGTNGGGLNIYDPKTQSFHKYGPPADGQGMQYLPSNGYIRALLEDRQGKMWIGSYGTSITVYDPKKKSFEILNGFRRSFPTNITNSFLEDQKGNIWIGTGGDGLLRITADHKHVSVYNGAKGLADDVIHKLLEDKDGRIWMSTNKGISWLDPSNGKIINYSYYNGLQNTSFKNGAGLVTADGTIYFGGGEGMNYINPKYIKYNNRKPSIMFTELKIGNKVVSGMDSDIVDNDISIAKTVNLAYKQNFALNFVALNFTSPRENRYSYRLKGFDKDWIYAGTKNTANYTNLSPGDYTFEVRACNNDGIWSNRTASITIHIEPPFWMTIWAYFFYVAVVLSALLLIRSRGIRKLQLKFDQEQLKREAERLREADIEKTNFYTNLSHDLCTPISLIMGPVEKLISRPDLDANSKMHLKIIKRNSRRMLNLVNQSLDFRSIEEHQLKLHLKKGEVISFIRDVSESFQELSEKKRIDFVFEATVSRLMIAFDADKLERIIFNLLSNAFKFSFEGGQVVLKVFLEKSSSEEDALILEVSDTGIGIDNSSLNLIFDRYYQSKNSRAVVNQGSGLGLSIVKEFVQAHGGQIRVESIEGSGTTFWVELPMTAQGNMEIMESAVPEATDPISVEEIESIETDDVPLTGDIENLPLILIVDDNADFRFLLSDSLKQHYRIIEATNGREGWKKALASRPELIVSDIMMPVMDGAELCRKLKSDKRTKLIPVILLTASTGQENHIKGLVSGANDYLNKPFSFEILDVRIQNLLTFNRTLQKSYSKYVQYEPAEMVVESVKDNFLKSVVQYMEENLTNTQLSVEDLSRHMGNSRSTTYNKLLEITGKSPVDFIRSFKLEKAAMLLENSDLNISQIAYKVGFATPNYFAKSFKAKYGILPSEYLVQTRKAAPNKAVTGLTKDANS